MADSFKSLSDIFSKEPGLAKVRKMVLYGDVVLEFGNIFPELAKNVVPLKFEKKTLFLKIENAAFRSELKYKESLIIEKINKYFNDGQLVKTVRVTG
jgi:Protein of unknown function (DUF721).